MNLTVQLWAARGLRRLTFVVGLVLAPMLVEAQPVHDNYANRKVIGSLPFEETEFAIGLATVEPTDPLIFCRQGGVATGGNTVWYSYTTGPVDQFVNLTTANSDYDTIAAFYTGEPEAFQLVSGGCDEDGAGSTRARVAGVRLRANTTYSLVVARYTESTATVALRIRLSAAPVFNVTKTADTADGVCDADCSLREAISASNAMPGAVVIPGGTYLLALPGAEDANASGDLDVRAGMGIYGASPTATVVDAGALDRAVDIDPSNTSRVSVLLHGLTLTNGNAAQAGGGLRVLNDLDFVTLEDVTITNSVAGTAGGGVSLDAISLLVRVTVSGNQAGTSGGGAFFGGTGRVEVRDSTISNNASLLNGSSGGGGGIHTRAELRLNQVTISGNTANWSGGGVFLDSRTLSMRNVTIFGNIADADNNDSSSSGGGLLRGSTLSSANSVIAGNRALGVVPVDFNDCHAAGGSESTSYNLVHSRDNCLFEGVGDAFNLPAQLSPTLAANGGPTATHAVLPGSPLIDTGNPTACLDDNGVPFVNDQRGPGFPRTIDGNGDTVAVCDKGAYEFQPGGPQPPNAPSNLVAVAIRNTFADLQWTDNSNNETSFQIERGPSAVGPWAHAGKVGADVTTFTDPTLGPLMTYYFRVYAQNAQGPSPPTMAVLVQTTPVELQRFTVE